jgi:two-component system alkaline phosphatase synthesis response regulator PhoP
LINNKVLILDEEPFVRDTLRLKLASKGLKALSADDEDSAKKIIQDDQPALILIDILHGRINIYRFIQELKGDTRTEGIPIAILTFKEKDPEMEFTYNVWARAYLTKPFSPREVVEKITALLEESRDTREASA